MAQLDEQATIANVKDVLSHYHTFSNLSKGLELMNGIPSLERLPAFTFPSQQLSRLDALQLKLNCEQVLAHMDGDAPALLHARYMATFSTDTIVMTKFKLSKSSYYRHLNNACIAFAELFGLMELRVFCQ